MEFICGICGSDSYAECGQGCAHDNIVPECEHTPPCRQEPHPIFMDDYSIATEVTVGYAQIAAENYFSWANFERELHDLGVE